MAELHIYTVSVFLSKERLAQTASNLKERGFSGSWHEFSDHAGEKARLFEVKEVEYAIVFTEANDFHRAGDFEIGLTVKTEAEWKQLLFDSELSAHFSFEEGKEFSLQSVGTEKNLIFRK